MALVCCPTCRLVQPPATRCAACGGAPLAPLAPCAPDAPAATSRLLGTRRAVRAGLLRTEAWPPAARALFKLLRFAAAMLLPVPVAVAVYELSGQSEGLGVCALLGGIFVLAPLVWLGPLPIIRRVLNPRADRLLAASAPPWRVEPRPDLALVTRTGRVRRIEAGAAEDPARAAPIASWTTLCGGSRDEVLARRARGEDFLVVTDAGERVLVAGTIIAEPGETGRRVDAASQLPPTLGIARDVRVEGVVHETELREGDLVEVTGVLGHEAVAALASYREGGAVPTLRGVPGAPAVLRKLASPPRDADAEKVRVATADEPADGDADDAQGAALQSRHRVE